MATANILLGAGQPANTWAPNYTGPILVSRTVAASSTTALVQIRFNPDGTVSLPAGGSGNRPTPWRWYDQVAATPWAYAKGFELEVVNRESVGLPGSIGPAVGFYSLQNGVTLTRGNDGNEGLSLVWGAAFGLRIWDTARTQYYSLRVVSLQLTVT